MKNYLLLVLVSLLGQAFGQRGFVPIDPSLIGEEKWGFLRQALKNNRIVALGESLHGVKEFNATKVELIQYLHEELGYNVLATESDVARNFWGNLDRNNIPDSVMVEQLFITPWHTTEYLELVHYLKAHPQLQLIGFDSDNRASALAIQQLLQISVDTTTVAARAFQQQHAQWPAVSGRGMAAAMGQRDSTMADIAQWIIDEQYPDQKIILLAHNHHIANAPQYGACMGALLKNRYRRKYYSIGFYHSLGDPVHLLRHFTYENDSTKLTENSVQAKFLATGQDQVFVNIRQQQKKQYPWLFKSLDSIFSTNEPVTTIQLSDAFDGLIWIKTVTHPAYVIPHEIWDRN